jgi:hypothetical protein
MKAFPQATAAAALASCGGNAAAALLTLVNMAFDNRAFHPGSHWHTIK